VAIDDGKFDDIKKLIHADKEKTTWKKKAKSAAMPAMRKSKKPMARLSIHSTSCASQSRESIARKATRTLILPGRAGKANDPVRMYLREMGTVPLLTREGEVEIAKRIERGQLRVLKALSRSP